MLDTLEQSLGVDLVPLIEKSELDRHSWEETNVLLGRRADWNQFADYATVGDTTPFTSTITALLRPHRAALYLMSDTDSDQRLIHTSIPLVERILAVEDDPQVRHHACDTLQDLGYVTCPAEHANEALELLERDPDIQLVFTDLVLPGGLSGADLMKIVRARYPGLPTLLTSGYTANKLDEGSSEDVLEKPYRRDALAKRVAAALRDARPRAKQAL